MSDSDVLDCAAERKIYDTLKIYIKMRQILCKDSFRFALLCINSSSKRVLSV